jgi:serine/threonine protein kinase
MPATSFAPPTQFEEYRLIRLLGRGSMGQVYQGHDSLLDRPVAIKFIAAIQPGKVARERFLVEARAIARLAHPNVVSVYRLGVVTGWPYLVSELVEGESLDRRQKTLAEPAAVRVALGLARGLAAAHRRGVLHRDIKPANVVLTPEGEAKLLDFGLAKLLDVHDAPAASASSTPTERRTPALDPDQTAPRAVEPRGEAPAATVPGLAVTRSGDLLGTPRYVAPEIWLGHDATPQSDLYSLGLVLYELVAGRLPHSGTTFEALRESVVSGELAPLREVAPHSTSGFAAIVDRCVKRRPEDRFRDADELLAALEQLGARAGAATRGRWLVAAASALVVGAATWVGLREADVAVPAPLSRPQPVLAPDAGPVLDARAPGPPPPAVAAPDVVTPKPRTPARTKGKRRAAAAVTEAVSAPAPAPAPAGPADEIDAVEKRRRRLLLID